MGRNTVLNSLINCSNYLFLTFAQFNLNHLLKFNDLQLITENNGKQNNETYLV